MIREEVDSKLRANDESIRRDLKHEEGSRIVRDEDLSERIEELSGAVLRGQFYSLELTEQLKKEDQARCEDTASARDSALLRDEHQQEQIDELATALMSEAKAWREGDELQDRKLSHVMGVEREERYDEEDRLRQEIQDSARLSLERDQHQQEQTDALAGVIISEAIRNHEERQARIQGDKTLHTEIARADRRNSERDQHLQEQADMTAQAVIRGQLQTLSTEKRLRSEEYSRDEAVRRIREVLIESTSHHQEQLDELTGLTLRKVLDEIEERRKRKIDTSHEIQSRQADTEHQQRQTNELAGAVLCGMLNSYRARGKIMARIAVIEAALIEDGILDEDDIPRYTDYEIDGMLEGIFSGNGADSEPDITDETDQEFYEDIAQIFNP